MRLVMDSNRLIAGLLKDSIAREIILSDAFVFYSPDYILTEIERHKGKLLEKSGLTENAFDMILYSLVERVHLVPFEDFEEHFEEALGIMKQVDIKDAPFLAVGIALNLDGIWTEDKHFQKQRLLRVFKTTDIYGTSQEEAEEL